MRHGSVQPLSGQDDGLARALGLGNVFAIYPLGLDSAWRGTTLRGGSDQTSNPPFRFIVWMVSYLLPNYDRRRQLPGTGFSSKDYPPLRPELRGPHVALQPYDKPNMNNFPTCFTTAESY